MFSAPPASQLCLDDAVLEPLGLRSLLHPLFSPDHVVHEASITLEGRLVLLDRPIGAGIVEDRDVKAPAAGSMGRVLHARGGHEPRDYDVIHIQRLQDAREARVVKAVLGGEHAQEETR